MRVTSALAFAIELALLSMAFGARSARAQQPVEQLGIKLRCDGDHRAGAAVLIEDFRPAHKGDVLLLTALHVVEGCTAIEPQLVRCREPGARGAHALPIEVAVLPILGSAWSAEHGIELLTWRELDLAAFVVPAAERDAFTRALRPLRIAEAVKAGVPPYPAELELRARSGLNVCPSIPAARRSMITVEQLWESMDETDRYAVLGSLADDTRLVSYTSSAQPGTSGGPLVWRHDRFEGVVAVHLGGKEGVLQWGVLVGADALRAGLAAQRGGSVWLDAEHPRVATPGFQQPGLVDADTEQLAELDVALDRNSLSLMSEVGTPIDPFGAISIFPNLGWSHLWFSPSFAPLSAAFGTRILAGPVFGLYRSPVSAPQLGREEKPREGSAKLPFHGGVAEIDAELHLARLAPIRYVVSAGLRLGWSHQRNVEPAQDTFVFGPVVSGRARWQWTGALSGLLQLNVSLQRIPVAATPRDCVGPSVPRPSVWDLWGSLAIGVETAL